MEHLMESRDTDSKPFKIDNSASMNPAELLFGKDPQIVQWSATFGQSAVQVGSLTIATTERDMMKRPARCYLL
jgi:hypothetical protein